MEAKGKLFIFKGENNLWSKWGEVVWKLKQIVLKSPWEQQKWEERAVCPLPLLAEIMQDDFKKMVWHASEIYIKAVATRVANMHW